MRDNIHQLDGKRYYKHGKFQDALKAFHNALKVKDADRLSLLDNLAATHCRLDQLDRALHCAKEMVQTFPEDARGYLRLGKVLLHKGSPEKALKVYDHGLRKIARGDPLRRTLEKMKSSFPPRLDPFTVMNIDVALEILQYLSFSQRVKIMRVSKTWAEIISSYPGFWHDIDFSAAVEPVSLQAINKYVAQSSGNLKSAIIRHLPPKTTSKVIAFLGRCPKLETLNIGLQDLDSPFFKIYTMKGLKNLSLSSIVSPKHEDITVFLENLPLLESIGLWDIKAIPNSRSTPKSWPDRAFPNMRSISLRSPLAANLIVPNILTAIDELQVFPNLEELVLQYSTVSRSMSPAVFPTAGPSLEGLHLPPIRRLYLKDHILHTQFFKILPKSLESLHIIGEVSLHPRIVDSIDGICPKLCELRLINMRGIRGSAALFRSYLDISLGCLRILHIEGCIQLSCETLLEIILARPAIVESLIHLSLIASPTCDDNVCLAFSVFKSLKYLDVSRSVITGCTLRYFADARVSNDESVPKLDTIVVDGCENISPDSVEYAQSKGLSVQAKNWAWRKRLKILDYGFL